MHKKCKILDFLHQNGHKILVQNANNMLSTI